MTIFKRNPEGQHSPQYDPILYAFMRACGAPGTAYNAYRRQLGFGKPRRRTRIYEIDAAHFTLADTAYAWADSKIRVLAATHYPDTVTVPDPEQCAHKVNAILDEIERATSASAAVRSGLTRKLMVAQARYWTSIVRTTPGVLSNLPDTRARAVSELVAEARFERWAQPERRARDRMERKYAQRKAAVLSAEWVAAKDRLAHAQRRYEKTRAAHARVSQQCTRVLAERRLADGLAAKLPAMLRDERAAARAAYEHAALARKQARSEFYAIKRKAHS